MKLSAESWPIACKMAFGPRTLAGQPIVEAGPRAWRRQLDQVSRLGFTHIDPTDDWVPFWELDEAGRSAFLAEIAEAGLTMASISMGRRSVVDAEHGLEYLDVSHRVVDLAKAWGVPVVNVGFMQPFTQAQKDALWFWLEQGHQDDPANYDLAVERIRDLADHAAADGIRISLELYEDTFVGTPDGAVQFVTDVDRSNVGVNPDVGNLVRLHRPVPTSQEMHTTLLPYANFWHMKNYLRAFDPATGAYFTHPAAMESGIIDYRTVIQQALALGYDGVFMMEHYGGDWLGTQARNARFVRSVLESVLT